MSRLRALLLIAALAVMLAVGVVLSLPAGTPQSATGSVHPAGWGATPHGYMPPRALTATVPAVTATMYDAVTVGNIPGRTFAAAGYTAGRYVTWPAVRALAQHAVSIAISASWHADCLDDEPGDATPSQAGPWVLADIHAGFPHPCVYGDLSNMPRIQASIASSLGAGWRARVFLWLAWYRGVPGLVAGYDAVQYTDRCLGLNLDCSTVSLAFLTIAQPPYVAPKPKPVRPVCFGARATPRSSACRPIVARVASDERAAGASARALYGTHVTLLEHGCQIPYRRGVCVDAGRAEGVLAQRVDYFTARTNALRQEYR